MKELDHEFSPINTSLIRAHWGKFVVNFFNREAMRAAFSGPG